MTVLKYCNQYENRNFLILIFNYTKKKMYNNEICNLFIHK